MPVGTLTSKGQITVPKAVREHLHLSTGDQVAFVILDGGQVVLRPLGRTVKDLCGFLRREHTSPVSADQLDESLMAHLRAEDDRVRRGD
jgi:antitoxin PrlF